MTKEILEITKRFHESYEKLSKEYSYETREDTKVFNVNSNNGMLMYATVNEIVSPILKENKQLKERIEYLERSNNRREDTILEQRQKNSDLEDNWNKLKEWIKVRDNIGLEKICLEDIVYKIVALEKGSDSNE